jgi:molybdopterin/thiamine biosynthesis adenylyltransferase
MAMKRTREAPRTAPKKREAQRIRSLRLERLRGKAIRLIGLGGIGSSMVSNLGRFLWSHDAKSLGITLHLVDGDSYELKNHERMAFQLVEGYHNKAIVKAIELADAFGDRLPIRPLTEYLTPENIAEVVLDGDVLFLAVDNHQTRKLVSDHCERMDNIVLFSGGNDGVEGNERGTFGNVQIYERLNGRDLKNPMTRFHPEVANPGDRAPYELGCEDLAQGSAPQLLFTNLAVASSMLNVFYAWLVGELGYEEVYVDIIAGSARPAYRDLAVHP